MQLVCKEEGQRKRKRKGKKNESSLNNAFAQPIKLWFPNKTFALVLEKQTLPVIYLGRKSQFTAIRLIALSLQVSAQK